MNEVDGSLELVSTKDKIVEVLKSKDEPVSTYRIAEDSEVSWSTVNTHLKDLQIDGVVQSKKTISKGKKTRVWWIEKEDLRDYLGQDD